jgi:hypothetical protein
VPAQVSDWFTRFSEPVRLRSRHPALDHFNRNTIKCDEFRFAVVETGDVASLRLQGDVHLDSRCAVAITEIQATQLGANVSIQERDN